MSNNDLVVVIPGIGGSTLERGTIPLWSTKPGKLITALTVLTTHLQTLQLPDGIGDEAPDDGVRAGTAISSLHVIPGLWSPAHGYQRLVRHLQPLFMPTKRHARGYAITNPLVFPYDRLSNRYTARQLKVFVERALGQWREYAPENRDAQVVFVCHSMGGLVARWYISCEGGAELTRKLITLGTPHRGALKALAVLTEGPLPQLGRFGEWLHQTAISFPSIAQLLPSYACVNGEHGPEYLVDQLCSPLPTRCIKDSARFYQELEVAEDADSGSRSRTHVIIGGSQNTAVSATLSGGRYRYSLLLDGIEPGGDGTVSAASVPKGIALDSNSIRRIADKHGNLHCNKAAIYEIESIITAAPIMIKSFASQDLSVCTPELVSADQRFSATITSPSGRCAVEIALYDERNTQVERLVKTIGTDPTVYTTDPLKPGGYTCTVRKTNDPLSGVTSPFLVWARH